jgi:acyl-CoA thioesterase-2
MHAAVEHLLEVLALESAGPGRWNARSVGDMGDRLFGGQVLGQCMVAAGKVVGPAPVHSLHACFLNRGTPAETIVFEVEQVRESRSFATCHVTAHQGSGAIFEAFVSTQEPEVGPVHQIPMDDVGEPRGESYERAMLQMMTPEGRAGREPPFELPVEIRAEGGLGLFDTGIRPPGVRCWMRMRDRLPDDPGLHQALFAYASDYAIMAPALNPHPISVLNIQSASLDHAIWFHRDFRMDEWILFELDSPVASGGRGIGRGLVYTRDGALVASCVQEGLMRPRAAPDGAPGPGGPASGRDRTVRSFRARGAAP